jgi:hypothetical protein
MLVNPLRYGMVIGLAVLASGAVLAEDPALWRAGAAAVNITPAESMWMAGYASRDRPAEGKLSDLHAKALLLEDAGGNRALLLTLDLVGIDRALSTRICRELAARYDLRRDQIAICTSHTHSGPVVGQNLAPMHYALVPPAQQARIDAYAENLLTKTVEIVGLAIDDLQPAILQQGRGSTDFAVNRRNNRPAEEVPARRAAMTLAGPIDHDVPVLAVRCEGKLRAIVFGYACHATVLDSMRWSGDYPGFAQAELEQLHPDCQAMFWAGCGADQNPEPRRTDDLARHYGRRLALAVDTVLMTTRMQDIRPPLQTSYAEIDIEFAELPSAQLLQQTIETGNRYEQSRARLLLNQIQSDRPLAPSYPYPIGVWKLGSELRWVMLGGEVVVDYALRLKSELDGATWVAGYCNDVMAYIPSRRVLAEGGYEGGSAMVYYGLPTLWAPTIENAIVGEVARQAAAN